MISGGVRVKELDLYKIPYEMVMDNHGGSRFSCVLFYEYAYDATASIFWYC
jgi:hypothetical protein